MVPLNIGSWIRSTFTENGKWGSPDLARDKAARNDIWLAELGRTKIAVFREAPPRVLRLAASCPHPFAKTSAWTYIVWRIEGSTNKQCSNTIQFLTYCCGYSVHCSMCYVIIHLSSSKTDLLKHWLPWGWHQSPVPYEESCRQSSHLLLQP